MSWWLLYLLVVHLPCGFLAYGLQKHFLCQLYDKERRDAADAIPALRNIYRIYDRQDDIACAIFFILGPIGLVVAISYFSGERFKMGFRLRVPEESRRLENK